MYQPNRVLSLPPRMLHTKFFSKSVQRLQRYRHFRIFKFLGSWAAQPIALATSPCSAPSLKDTSCQFGSKSIKRLLRYGYFCTFWISSAPVRFNQMHRQPDLALSMSQRIFHTNFYPNRSSGCRNMGTSIFGGFHGCWAVRPNALAT